MKKLLILIAIISSQPMFSTTITIGTGTASNGVFAFPTPYGGLFMGTKQQFLITAAELNAAGMTNGDINNLAFDVAFANGTVLQNFSIAIGSTASSALSVWETGLTTVLPSVSYTAVNGINTHVFSSPYFWNGTSNLVVEVCFNSPSGGPFSFNSTTRYSTTAFNSTIIFRDNALGVCSSSSITNLSMNRPNMVFDWTVANLPPTSKFGADNTSPCLGTVAFTDSSSNTPTSWAWSFGDGGTSTLQNPSHTYVANGSYDVELIACNALGCDTLVKTNYININLSASTPAVACIPNSLNYCCGFGITNVTFNTINNSTNDAVDGYQDYTCSQTTVFAGQNYTLSIQTSAPTTQNYAAWIDYNNDGIFNDVTERVLTAASQMNTSGIVTIPSGAVLNTPLRLRVSADYDFSVAPTPCTDLDRGQAEDYTVIINVNTSPPTSIFSGDPTTTCDGTVCFTDQSLNVPTSWAWTFGDGGTSVLQHPCHTYSTDGTYTVSLTVTNANGSNTTTTTNFVTVNTAAQLSAASCTPATSAYCCSYGIYQVNFNTISNATTDGIDGYQDYSCENSTSVIEGSIYNLTVQTGTGNPQDTRAWIDFNNDGVFNNTNELVMDIASSYNPSLNISIPSGAVTGTPLRMRISSDIIGTPQSACDPNAFGQTEDYGIIIQPTVLSPVANFSATPTSTCAVPVCFTDLSSNAPTTWLWYFGDGTTSTLQNPCHTYSVDGYYSIKLVVSNALGADSMLLSNYININCANITMPTTGTNITNLCSGTLYDDGGAGGNYSNNTNGVVVIQPTGASQVNVTFTTFNMELNFDYVNVYDGPSTASPLLGSFDGTTLPPSISSSGGSITIEQTSDNNLTRPGFSLNWACSLPGSSPTANFSATPTSTCATPVCFTDLSIGTPTSWMWYFGDGSTSTLQNPCHTYLIDGSYSVKLVATNGGGADSLTYTNYITINCTNINMPTSGTNIITACNGTLYDNGGSGANYSPNTDGIVVIQPVGATQINLTFTFFDFVTSSAGDTLFIYDGATTSSPLLGAFTGNPLPPPISSTGGVITIRQKTNATVNDPGFALNWSCAIVGALPVANFSASPTSTCSTPVCFTDLSTGVPTSWLWYFGDGFTSTLQNPCHTYLTDGLYTVSLVVTNSSGQDSTGISNYIDIDCSNLNMPTTGTITTSLCSGTLYDSGGPTANYTNNTNGVMIIAPTGATQVSVTFTSFNMENTFDFVNVYDGPSTSSPLLGSYTGTSFPATINSSGGSITIEQTSDFAATRPGFSLNWSCAVIAPTANFSATPIATCTTAPVCFTDLSSPSPTSWKWYFGDGGTSTTQNPCYTYLVEGTYTVSLVVTNGTGQDSIAFIDYIDIDCSKIMLPFSGVDTTTKCTGTLYDDGGATANYSNNSDGVVSIQPTSGIQVTLNFNSFSFATNDTLFIYDGPSISSPLISAHIGNTVPSTIISTGGSITIRQKTNNTIKSPGFELEWACKTNGIVESKLNSNQFLVYPNPTNGILNIETKELQNTITEVVLYNSLGKTVLQKLVQKENSSALQLNVSHLSKGLYFLNILSNDGVATIKINIQ